MSLGCFWKGGRVQSMYVLMIKLEEKLRSNWQLAGSQVLMGRLGTGWG